MILPSHCAFWRSILPSRLRTAQSLESFVIENDHIIFGPNDGLTSELNKPPTPTKALRRFRNLVNVHVANDFDSLPALYSYLDDINLLNPERLRPGWDTYFMVIVHHHTAYLILHVCRHSQNWLRIDQIV